MNPTRPVRYRGRTLSTAQVMALRGLIEDGETDAHANTMRSLKKKKLLDDDGKPTDAAKTWVTSYVNKTGDGPELLKESFRGVFG